MADTTELERIYTIPLRHAKMGTRSKRADRAVKDVRTFLSRHMKSETIWLDNEVNEAIWSRGKYNIRSRIRVRATRFADGVVEVTLPDAEATGSMRAAIAEKLEKAAEAPVLAPSMEEEESEEARRSVTVIAGIGAATAEKLEKAEIETVGDLAGADVAEVAKAVGKSNEVVRGWIDAAKEMVKVSEEPEAEEPAAEEAAETEAAETESKAAEAEPEAAEPTDDSEE